MTTRPGGTGRLATVTEQRRPLGRVFDEVPDLYDRMRPGYPPALFRDLAHLTGLGAGSDVLEVGCGTGQATRPLAELTGTVTAVEPGDGMAELARRHLADLGNVDIERSTFDAWDDKGRRFDAVVAASSWHWVDPTVGWRRAHDVLRPGGWLAVLGHVVVRRPGESEVYAETADLHERFAPGDPDWGDPPLEHDVRATNEGWGRPTKIAIACSARPWCGGIRRCSGSTGRASPTCCERCPSIASSPPTSVSLSSMPWPTGSGHVWATVPRAAISPCCASANDSTEAPTRRDELRGAQPSN